MSGYDIPKHLFNKTTLKTDRNLKTKNAILNYKFLIRSKII